VLACHTLSSHPEFCFFMLVNSTFGTCDSRSGFLITLNCSSTGLYFIQLAFFFNYSSAFQSLSWLRYGGKFLCHPDASYKCTLLGSCINTLVTTIAVKFGQENRGRMDTLPEIHSGSTGAHLSITVTELMHLRLVCNTSHCTYIGPPKHCLLQQSTVLIGI
jgi:hypothetical protein